MGLLFSGLDPRDSASIIERLDAANVPYQIKGDGSTILVPQDRALRLRMQMAGDGLPAGGGVGYGSSTIRTRWASPRSSRTSTG